MRLATVTLKHKKKGTTITVNQEDYAEDLGKERYSGYALVNASHNDDEAATIEVVEPTEPPVEPTEPPVEPTEPPVEPTEPVVEPTEPEAIDATKPKPRRGRRT